MSLLLRQRLVFASAGAAAAGALYADTLHAVLASAEATAQALPGPPPPSKAPPPPEPLVGPRFRAEVARGFNAAVDAAGGALVGALAAREW